jgi:cell division transport system permease protein
MAGFIVKGRFPRRRLVHVVVGNIFRYMCLGALRNWLRNIGSTAPALGSMTLLLLLTGLVGLSGFALNNLEQIQASEASLLHVYLRDDAAQQDIDAAWAHLQNDPRVATVTYVTKEEALARAKRRPGLPQLADASESNPFPASLDVQVKAINDVGAIDKMVRPYAAVDPIYPTSYDQGAYQRIQSVLFGVAVAGIVFLALMGFVAVTVTANSIRAAILSRHDELTIMQLVGAPRWMVRGPFVIEGAITGAFSGGLAGAVVFGLAFAGIQAGAGTFTQFAPGITVSVALAAAAVVLATGVGLGSSSSLLSLRRHLES